MLGLKVNDAFLELYPNTAITINIINPIFDKDSAERIWSYPFKIPASAKNKSILGHLERLDAKPKGNKLSGQLFIGGIIFDEGIVKLLDANQKDLELVLQGKALSLFSDLEDFDIDEILEVIQVPQVVLAKWELKALDPPSLFEITINGQSYSHIGLGGTSPEDALDALIPLINVDYPGLASKQATLPGQVDQLHLETSEDIQVSIVDGFTVLLERNYGDARQDNFIQYFLDLKNNPSASHAFPVLNILNFYGGANPSFKSYFNYYSNGATIFNTPQDSPSFEHSFIPLIRIPYLIVKILEKNGLETSVKGNWFNQQDIQALLMGSNMAIDELRNYTDINGEEKWLNIFKESFDLNEQVPSISAKAFFSAFLEFFNTYLISRGNAIEIRKKIDQLNGVPVNWTKKCEPDYAFTHQANEGFTLDYSRDESDSAKVAGQLEPYSDGKEKIKTIFSTYYEINKQLAINGIFNWTVPYSKQKGSSDELGLGKNEISPRLLFDRGLQEDSEGNLYHLATHRNRNYNENEIGDIALDWNDNLYESHWKGYPELLQARPITKVIRLSIQDILQVRKWNNARVIIAHQKGQITGVIKSIQFKATSSGITLSKVELYGN